MPDPFLTLDGGGGEFLSRADHNLLDADTAHFQQSTGAWDTNGGAISLSTDIPGVFGTKVFRQAVNGNTSQVTRTPSGLDGFPIVGGAPLVISAYLASSEPRNATIGVQEFDAAGDSLAAGGNSVSVPLTTDFQQASLVLVAHPDAAFARLITNYSGATAGDLFYMSAWMINQQDDDVTFVPSLRIVGSLDDRVDAILRSGAQGLQMVSNRLGTLGYDWLITASGDFFMRYGSLAGGRSITMAGMAPQVDVRARYRVTFDIDTGQWEGFIDEGSVSTPAPSVTDPGAYGDATLGVFGLPTGAGAYPCDAFSYERRDGIDGPVVYRMDAADVLAAL